MSEPKERSTRYAPVWGIFLLFLGIVLLLQTLSLLPWGIWGKLWRFWPVFIIAVGISILLRRYHPWLVSALILLLFAASLGFAFWQYTTQPGWQITSNYAAPLNLLAKARVKIDFSAGDMQVSVLPGSSTNFVEAKGNQEIAVNFSRLDGTGSLSLTTEQTNRQLNEPTRWDIYFSPNLPLNFEVRSAVGNINLDLQALNIPELRLSVNAGNCAVTLPSAGITRAELQADIANLDITIPPGVAARIKADVSLATITINESRFPRQGDSFVSPDFATAQDRCELVLSCDIGRVTVK